MASGGTRFARPERSPRSGAAPRVIDVEVRQPHKTLYEALIVPPTTSSRQIRRIARALRRNLPDVSALHDVCLAEQVLGRSDLRAEYDALLARLRAAKQPIPNIGAAIEGSRLGRAFATRVGGASASAVGKLVKLILQIALVIAVIAIIVAGLAVSGGKHRSDRYKIPDFKPIAIPKIDLDLKPFELKPIEIPKLDIPKLEVRMLDRDTIEIRRFDRNGIEIPKHTPPKPTAPKPRKIDPPPP